MLRREGTIVNHKKLYRLYREEKLYVRIEDVVVVTAEGAENLSAFVPSTVEDIERLMTEKGIIQFRPAIALPLKR